MSAEKKSEAKNKILAIGGIYSGPGNYDFDYDPSDHYTGIRFDQPPKKSKSKPAAKSSEKPKSTGKKK